MYLFIWDLPSALKTEQIIAYDILMMFIRRVRITFVVNNF